MDAQEPQSSKPKLKLELIRGGWGPGTPTAVGTDEPDGEPDYPISQIPAWFRLMLPFAKWNVKRLLRSLPDPQRALLLRKIKLSKRHRMLLAWRWQFHTDECMRPIDAKRIMVDCADLRLSLLVRNIENHAAWHIWRYWND